MLILLPSFGVIFFPDPGESAQGLTTVLEVRELVPYEDTG